MPNRKKKPGKRTMVRAVCCRSSAGEDWPQARSLQPPRSPSLDLVARLAAGPHPRSHPSLVFLSPSPSSRCPSVSLQTVSCPQYFLTPTVVLDLLWQSRYTNIRGAASVIAGILGLGVMNGYLVIILTLVFA